jgi:hypothetical protein
MIKLIFMAAMLLAAGNAGAFCGYTDQYCYQGGSYQGDQYTARMLQQQAEQQQQREMMAIQQERNRIMEQANRIQQYPQLYVFPNQQYNYNRGYR